MQLNKPTTGTATNWYNELYYPGGSSSGAGSALSAGIVPITLGTDAGEYGLFKSLGDITDTFPRRQRANSISLLWRVWPQDHFQPAMQQEFSLLRHWASNIDSGGSNDCIPVHVATESG
jgi:hypothetical protein